MEFHAQQSTGTMICGYHTIPVPMYNKMLIVIYGYITAMTMESWYILAP